LSLIVVFSREKLICVESTQKNAFQIWAITNHKSQICDCDTQTQMIWECSNICRLYYMQIFMKVVVFGGGGQGGVVVVIVVIRGYRVHCMVVQSFWTNQPSTGMAQAGGGWQREHMGAARR
jgi:hypothetical protein